SCCTGAPICGTSTRRRMRDEGGGPALRTLARHRFHVGCFLRHVRERRILSDKAEQLCPHRGTDKAAAPCNSARWSRPAFRNDRTVSVAPAASADFSAKLADQITLLVLSAPSSIRNSPT